MALHKVSFIANSTFETGNLLQKQPGYFQQSKKNPATDRISAGFSQFEPLRFNSALAGCWLIIGSWVRHVSDHIYTTV